MKWLVVMSEIWYLQSSISGLFSPESWLAQTLCTVVGNRKTQRSFFCLWTLYLQRAEKVIYLAAVSFTMVCSVGVA